MKLRPGRTKSRPVRPEAPLPRELSRSALTQPAVSGAPRRRRLRRILVACTGALVLVAALAGAAWATWPSLDTGELPDVTRSAAPSLSLTVQRPLGLSSDDVDVRIGSERVTRAGIDVRGGRVTVQLPNLEDGTHDVQVALRGVGPLRRTLRATHTIVVDTKAPSARLVTPAPVRTATGYVAAGTAVVTERPAALEVDAEAGASIVVATSAPDAEPVRLAGGELPDDGSVTIDLPDGAQVLTITARDEAGNERVVRRRVLVDTRGPRLAAPLERIVTDAALGANVRLSDPHGVELRAFIDGTELEEGITRTIVTAAPAGAGGGAGSDDTSENSPGATPPAATEDGDADDAEALPIAASYRIALDEALFEGRHTLELVATDSLGSTTRTKRMFVVDSTETLAGASGLRPGARGADVAELHRALVERDGANRTKLAAELRTNAYGPQTAAVVRAYQSSRGMDADGVAGSDTLAALTLKVVIDRATKRLTLYRAGQVVKTYGVAVGSPKYPTPAGNFAIQNMQKHPTWTPPDSDWAKDAKPIAPGPDNPLGTRWMAIDGTVGIHGTNNPASIGFSVTHGCIRMRIPDVEELFEIVRVGTPVTVV